MILLKRRGCPPVLHLTVILSSESADLMRFSFVRCFSSSAVNGVDICSNGLTVFCFSNGDVATSTAVNRSNGDVCISVVHGTFAGVDVDVLGGQKMDDACSVESLPLFEGDMSSVKS